MDLSPFHLVGLATACVCLALGVYTVAAGQVPRLLTRRQPSPRPRPAGAALILVGIGVAVNALNSLLTSGSALASLAVGLLGSACMLGGSVWMLVLTVSARNTLRQPPRS
ncbi:hypothetical protein SAMN05444920_102899 [Nonomuraea solani]|uniref:Uncharacterized protein n=2 Tax=Nonomuraea solani TaxID=1144553 RepID=A0A1H5ZVK7_9ACTN|nr:hypothetical protein SAMN05444920_102899 [Nonomuraea solani]